MKKSETEKETLKAPVDKRGKYRKKLSTLHEEDEYKESEDSPNNRQYKTFQKQDNTFKPSFNTNE